MSNQQAEIHSPYVQIVRNQRYFTDEGVLFAPPPPWEHSYPVAADVNIKSIWQLTVLRVSSSKDESVVNRNSTTGAVRPR